MSFVASCHHRVLQCFKYPGNSKHDNDGEHRVSLHEFQEAIRVRHAAGASPAEVEASQVCVGGFA